MTFAYSSYLLNNLILPIFGLAFIAIPMFKFISNIIMAKLKGESVSLGDTRMVILPILLALLAVILAGILFRGGVHLIYERADDAVTIQGTIEEIDTCSIVEGPQYTVNGERSNGYEITVDGVTCTSMALGTLEVGDEVTVTYMPNSGFILSIVEES